MNLVVCHADRQVAKVVVTPGSLAAVTVLDPIFESWAKRLAEGQISVMRDHLHKATHTMFLTTTDHRDEQYPLAVKQFLERNGFDVTIDDPELDQKLLAAAQSLPEDLWAEALRDISTLTTLEKTTLLEKLATV